MIHNLLDRMKLPFRKNKEFLSVLYDILGFYPHDVEIYRVAFSHKSLTYHTEPNGGKDRRNGRREKRPRTENTSKPLNNERLEYLGDAVLETVVSDILFRHFEHKREGFLTSTRSKIVQREALNRLAEQMGLEALIQAAQGTRMSHTNIGGNAFEALMGAIYLDRGFKYCHWFITNRVIGTYVDLDTVAQKEVNFKSKLLEWCQKNRINTDFRDSGGADGERGFRTSIVLEGITVGKGSGRSKKESQQVAAKDALSRMRREQKLYDSIFRAKEKRTAMEADESFALPKIDEAEDIVSKAKGKDKPVLEDETGRRKNFADADGYHDSSDAAYDEAYGDNPKYEVIDDPDNESEYSDYATSIQPDEDDDAQAAPAPAARSQKKSKPAATKDVAKDKAANGKEKSAAGKEKSVSDKEKDKPAQSKDAAEEPERKPQTKAERKRERNRTAKTIDDAVKGSKKVKAEAPAPQPELANAENATDEAANTPEQKPMSESAKRRQRRKARREAMEADETNPFVELDKERKEETEASSAAEVSSATEVSSTAEVEEDILETVELHVAPETDEAKADIESEPSAAEPETVTTSEEEATETAVSSVSAEPETPAEPTAEELVAEEKPAAEEEPAAEELISNIESEHQPAEAPQAEASAEPIEADADDIETDSDDEEVPSESGESSEDKNVSDDEEADEVFDEEEVPADEEEEEYEEEDEEETPSEPQSLAEEAALPKLRHISLDDFVFGATDATTFDRNEEASSDDDAESDSASDERRQRNARSRRRKPNRSKKPADKAEKNAEAPKGEGKAKKHNADDAADAQVRIDREKAAKRRAQQRRRRRRESNKGDNFAGEE